MSSENQKTAENALNLFCRLHALSHQSVLYRPHQLPHLRQIYRCGNQGLGFAVYPNTLPNGKPNPKTDKSYSSFIPARFDDQVPEFTGVAKNIAITDANSLYGYKPKNYEFTAVNHKGYLYAPFAGDYTFSIPKADGFALLWVGPSAKFNWTRATASLTQIHPPTLSNVYNATFAAGEYI